MRVEPEPPLFLPTTKTTFSRKNDFLSRKMDDAMSHNMTYILAGGAVAVAIAVVFVRRRESALYPF